jgi:hypothetical protein
MPTKYLVVENDPTQLDALSEIASMLNLDPVVELSPEESGHAVTMPLKDSDLPKVAANIGSTLGVDDITPFLDSNLVLHIWVDDNPRNAPKYVLESSIITVFPVPNGWSPEVAWESRGQIPAEIPDDEITWSLAVTTEDNRFIRLIDEDEVNL